jgi:glycosyltransferase involved in cell wall biosynthesis
MAACRRARSRNFLPITNIFSERKALLSSSLKILQMVQTLDPSVGGVAPAVLALSRELARRGHKIDIVTLDEPDAGGSGVESEPRSATAATGDVDLTVHALGTGLTSYRYSKSVMPWLRKRGDNYDQVIVHGLWQYLSFAAWRRYSRTSTPYYVFPHGMLDPWFKRTYPLKHLKKWLYWPWADYRVLRDAAAVIFTSEEERLQARKSFWLYRCREKVSPLGIEPPSSISPETKEKFLACYPSLRNNSILLYLGRLHQKKGCDLLIDAFRKLKPSGVTLVLAGPDRIGWEKELRAGITDADLAARIVFTGMLRGETKQAALACADAFILPSHQENFGISVVEALAAGLPVLVSNRVNIWREIDADRAGYIENDDLTGTTRLIERWLGTSEQGRKVMRTNARNCFAQRYQIDRAVDSLSRILQEERRAQ